MPITNTMLTLDCFLFFFRYCFYIFYFNHVLAKEFARLVLIQSKTTSQKWYVPRYKIHDNFILIDCGSCMVCHKTYYVIQHYTNDTCSHSTKLQSILTNSCQTLLFQTFTSKHYYSSLHIIPAPSSPHPHL